MVEEYPMKKVSIVYWTTRKNLKRYVVYIEGNQHTYRKNVTMEEALVETAAMKSKGWQVEIIE